MASRATRPDPATEAITTAAAEPPTGAATEPDAAAAEAAPASPPVDGMVRVKLAHFKTYEGQEYRPGDVLDVPASTAQSWVWGGYAKLVDGEQDGEPKQ